jgi:hypothetical protein
LARPAELDRAAQSGAIVALAVGFRSTTSFVFHNDRDELAKLIGLMEEGGLPCGLLRCVLGDGKVQVSSRALLEGDDIQEYLAAFTATFFELAQAYANGDASSKPN